MRIAVWIVSGMLALVLLGTGTQKLVLSAADLAATVEGVPVALLRIAGAAEVLGALGLILPAVTRILPILTPVAAGGLALTMAGATITNFIVGKYGMAALTIGLGALAVFVAWARFGQYAIEPRATSAVPATVGRG